MGFEHIPVLLNEVIEGLNIDPDGIYVDGTLGGAGHSYEIAKRLKGGRLIGIDRDEDAIAAASERLEPFSDRVTIVRGNYGDMADILGDIGISEVDGILLDLGVSSHQLDEAERGFSYREDAPLDMRMDRRDELTAYDVVNTYTEAELTRILKDYGEERFAGSIARHIVRARAERPVSTTFELSDIIKASIPAKYRDKKGHPAKRSFQAIRIEVNHELDILRDSLNGMIDILKPGGRLCVISFHSLEDRIVKNFLKSGNFEGKVEKDFYGHVKRNFELVNRKVIVPSEEEIERNPRARSAKLRIAEKRE